MKMSNEKRNFCEAFPLCYISATVTYGLHMSAILFRRNSEKILSRLPSSEEWFGYQLSRPIASYSVRSRERQVTKLRTPHPSLIALSHGLGEAHAGTSVNLNQQPQVKKLSPKKTFQETSKMAVFTLEDALSVWSSFGGDSFFVWLFRSQG